MTIEFALLIAQTSATFFLAAWLTTGALENLLKPVLNSTFTGEVMEMSRMAVDYPDHFELVKHRAVKNKRVQRLLFRLIVLWECIAAIVLWIGVVMLALALFGAAAEAARAYALVGATLFTATWSGFLVVGNWFCYWYCHEGAQNTHYQMTLWGLGTMILLAL